MPRKTIVIYDGDDFERLADLRNEVGVAERAAELASGMSSRLGDATPDGVQAARDAYDSFVDVAAGRAEAWELHSIGHEAWRDLLAAHPARQVDGEDGKKVEHPEDASWGVNTESFGKALLLFVDPEDGDHRTVAKLGDAEPGTVLPKRLRRLSQGQFDTLWITAYGLNTGGVADPKASRYSIAPRLNES
jgi:hypothetical protein